MVYTCLHKSMMDYSKKTFSDGDPNRLGVWHQAVFSIISTANKCIIDIGCGTGGFLKQCKNENAKLITGVDPNKENFLIAKKFGIDVINDFPENLDSSFFSQYDIATCFEVIEHTYTHKDIIKSISQLLRSGGTGIITTPNAFNVMRRIKFTFLEEHHDSLMDPTRAKYPEHVRLWSCPMMKRLCDHLNDITVTQVYGLVVINGRPIILKNRILVGLFSQHLIAFLKKT